MQGRRWITDTREIAPCQSLCLKPLSRFLVGKSINLFTWSPQGDALLLMSLADAVVAVAINVVAGVPIMQINVGWAVRVGTSTELRQVTGVTGLSTQSAGHFQLRAHKHSTVN